MNIKRIFNTPYELGQVGKLWVKLIAETYPENNPSVEMFLIDTINLMLGHRGYTMFAAEDNGKIIGFVDGIVQDDPVLGVPCGRGRHIYIEPEYRSSLVGLQLIETQEQFGKTNLNAKAAKINCVPKQVKLYEMVGYEPIETLMFKKI